MASEHWNVIGKDDSGQKLGNLSSINNLLLDASFSKTCPGETCKVRGTETVSIKTSNLSLRRGICHHSLFIKTRKRQQWRIILLWISQENLFYGNRISLKDANWRTVNNKIQAVSTFGLIFHVKLKQATKQTCALGTKCFA